MTVNLLPLFASNVFYLYIDEDTSELDCNDFGWNDIDQPLVPKSTAYTSDSIKVLDKYPKTRKILLDKFNEIARNVLEFECDFEIGTSWMTKIKPGGHSHYHSHRNYFYSGVYYFGDSYSQDSGHIQFKNPVNQLYDYYINHTKSIHTSRHWKIPPASKKLILFPSYLEHVVMENKEDVDRYSLAFNMFPIGKYGSADSTYDENHKDFLMS